MTRTFLTLAALIALTSATTAHAGLTENGLKFNALSENGLKFNGLKFNALTDNGLKFNALSDNGLKSNALSDNGLKFNALSDNGLKFNAAHSYSFPAGQPAAYLPVPVVVFAITLPDGSVLSAAPSEF